MQYRDGAPIPYHVTPGLAAGKRLLLISYHAPPSNEVGALRWAGMARHLHARGWGLDILAVEPSELSSRNEALVTDLPAGTRLFGVPEVPPAFDRVVGAMVRVRQRLRARLNIAATVPAGAMRSGPVAREALAPKDLVNAFHAWREYARGRQWARRAARAGRQIFDPRLHHWVVSSGPPQMSHEGGRLLSLWTGLPFLADFRDPWRFSEWVTLGRAWLQLAAKYEAPVVEHSAVTVTNTDAVRDLMLQAYPGTRIVTITNGVDEGLIPSPAMTRKFIVGYPGTIYVGRDPEPLFDAVGRMARELHLGPDDLGLEFMGFFDAETKAELEQLAARHGVEAFLAVRPGRPRPEALEFMRSCAVLVTLQQGSDLAIPAKLFEQMRFPSWLLVLAGRGSATHRLLEGTAADVLAPTDAGGIHAALSAHYRAFQAGGRPAPIGSEERFSRRFQVERLVEAMEVVTPLARQAGARP